MLKLKTYTTEPQGGWVCHVPTLKMRVRAGTFNRLILAVREIMHINKVTIPENLAEIIEDEICRNTAKVFVANPDASFIGMVTTGDMHSSVEKLPRTLHDAIDAHAVGVVRADICKTCQYNVPTVCITCGGWDSIYRSMFPRLTQSMHPQVHTCQIDCLPGLVTLFADLPMLETAMKPRVPYPDKCWKRKPLP